jgi:hypothetical protein
MRDLIAIIPEKWMEDAKCKNADPDEYETKNLPRNARKPWLFREKAELLCRGCQVKADCADYALRWDAVGVVMAGVPLRLPGENAQTYAELESIRQRKFHEAR